MPQERLSELLNFDIDRYLNPFIPQNRLYLFPRPVQHFLGYRKEPHKEPPALVQWIITFISTLAGLCLVGGLYNYAPGIEKLNPPVIVASLGASAVLDYNAIRSPLAQPRNSILGHTLSALVGVCIAKLFQLNENLFENYGWVSGAVGCACASLAMSMTNTIHPPGGATAILASTEASVIQLGWMFVPLILLASVLMTAVACLFNNTLRQYPCYWWTAGDVGSKLRAARRSEARGEKEDDEIDGAELEKYVSSTDSARTLHDGHERSIEKEDSSEVLTIMPHKIRVPRHIEMTQDEIDLLQNLQERLTMHAVVGG